MQGDSARVAGGAMDCPFCHEFNDVDDSEFRSLFPADELLNRTVAQDDLFTVVAGIGAINPGYVLLLPRRHTRCFANLTDDEAAGADMWFRKIRDTLSKVYTDPFIFEHGSRSIRAKSGSCIDHAHLHFVPTEVDPCNHLKRSMRYSKIDSLGDLIGKFGEDEPYLLGSKRGEVFTFSPDPLSPPPSQFLRRLLCQLEGRPDEWDWAVFPEKENMRSTVLRLTGSTELWRVE
ncbi:HIT domain-containing protein [Streptomyces sp. NPDC086777]|uniref:HIT family protein n=1 Tax=Streptomyces sp. NPDC086777 TaxID=3154866 RepID=UPI00344EA0CE